VVTRDRAMRPLARDASCHPGPWSSRVSYYNSLVDVHESACRHGIADEDIRHAVDNAMTIDDQENDTRLYLGPSRSAALLEVVTIVRAGRPELAIHAMLMRAKYRRLLGES
jgi:hypothetical protein